MDLTKETLNHGKNKAEERINDWIKSCHNAGITRLYDRYGISTFKRIEYKKKDDQKTLKTVIPTQLQPLKLQKNIKREKQHDESEEKECDYNMYKKKIDAGKAMKSGQCRDLSRHGTPLSDSTKRLRDSASLLREMDNRSAHNRSSNRNSVCSMDAISLICEEPIDYSPEDYLHSNFERKLKSSNLKFLSFIDTSKSQQRKDTFNKSVTKSTFATLKFPKGHLYEKSNLSTVARAEKSFYNCDRVEDFKPAMTKLTCNRDRKFKKKLPKQFATKDIRASKSDSSDHDVSNVDQQILHLPPITSKQIASPMNTSRPSSISNMPVTFTIDTSSRTDITNKVSKPSFKMEISTEDSARTTNSSLGFRPGSKSGLVRNSSSMGNLKLSVSPSRMTRQVSSMGLRRNKSRINRINMSTTPSTVLRSDTLRKKCPGALQSSSNLPSDENKVHVPLKQLTPLDKFRNFTNKFIAASRLLILVKAKMKEQNREVLTTVKKAQEDAFQNKNVLDFDASYYRTATNSYGGLTNRARDALWKRVHNRTEKDIRTLKEVMERLPFFNKYPQSIKSELARMLWYDRFENGRVIIRQGDIGTRMYFVVSGCVSLQSVATDPVTGIKRVVHLQDVKSGSTFGELALIRDMKRTYTAVCKGDSEFLSLSKNEFNNVLRDIWEQMWQERHNFVESLRTFENASQNQKKNATDMSEIKNFLNNEVIFGDKKELTESVFFVKKGKCEMIKRVSLVRSQSPYLRPSLFLPDAKKDFSQFLDKPYGKKHRICRTETHMLTVMSLYPGDCFGVGENLEDTFIIAKGKVECLLINSAFFAINLMMDRLEASKLEIEEKIPSNRELYRKFEANRKWIEYKKQLVEGVVKRKSAPNVTTKGDIPKALVMEPNIPEDLQWIKNIK